MMTQCEKVLNYMAIYGGITQLDAMRDLGVMRLSERIRELQKECCIDKEMVTVPNRWGQDCRVMKYRLGNGDGKPDVKIGNMTFHDYGNDDKYEASEQAVMSL